MTVMSLQTTSKQIFEKDFRNEVPYRTVRMEAIQMKM